MSAPEPRERVDVVAVRDADDVLLDDRPGVELLGHVVRGRADQLHAALARLRVRLGAGERRQERVVDVDHRHADAVEELAGEDLHVAGEDDEVAVPAEQLEQPRLRLGLRVRRRPARGGRARRAPRRRARRSAWLEATSTSSASSSPRRRRQSSSSRQWSSRETSTATRLGTAASQNDQSMSKRSADLLAEALREPVRARRRVNSMRRKNVPPVGIGRVLVRAHDVRPGLREESGHRADDPGTVGAGDEKADRGHGGSVFRHPRLDLHILQETNRLRDP